MGDYYFQRLNDIFLMVKIYTMCWCINVRDFITRKLGVGHIHTEDDHMHIHYSIGEHTYRIMSPVNIKPSPIIKVTSNDKNVTEYVRSYMGPHNNFHGLKYTPKMFGFDKMTVVYREKFRVVTYTGDECIKLDGS